MREKNTKWKYYVISGVSILVFLLVWYLISDVFSCIPPQYAARAGQNRPVIFCKADL